MSRLVGSVNVLMNIVLMNTMLVNVTHMRSIPVVLLVACIVSGCRPVAKPPQVAAPQVTPQLKLPGDTSAPAATPAAVDQTSEVSTTAPGEPPASNVGSSKNDPAHEKAAEKATEAWNWTVERLVILGKGGPRLIDIKIRCGTFDLARGLERTTQHLAEELELSFKAPGVTWDELLKRPLVSSGWLGNLVPSAEQREQFLTLYDTNRNTVVDEAEFAAFLTRGISRSPRVRVAQSAAVSRPGATFWGPLDRDSDGQLTQAEWLAAPALMSAYDVDGDQTISSSEVVTASDVDNAMAMPAMRQSFIESGQLHRLGGEQTPAAINSLLETYSFSDTVPVDAFYGWPKGDLLLLDEDGDGQLTRTELKRLESIPAHCILSVAFPDTVSSRPMNSESMNRESERSDFLDSDIVRPKIEVAHGEARARDDLQTTSTLKLWRANTSGGRIALDGCISDVRVADDYTPNAQRIFAERFAVALKSPALFGQLRAQMELKEGADDLLRSMSSNQAARTAWYWSVSAKHWNVAVTWSAPAVGWFEIIDENGDQKLTSSELRGFTKSVASLDRDANGLIEAEESPLVLLLVVGRSDSRGVFSILGGTPIEKRGTNVLVAPTWFSGMDYNSDGELSRAEFLGEASDFNRLDLNKDGIIEASEVQH